MSHPSSADRLQRLQNVLNTLLVQGRFTLLQAKAGLASEMPAFVTRLVQELEKQGHLRRDDDGVFSWTCEPGDFPAQAWLESKVYGAQLPQTPAADRPRERLLALGAPALRTAELLAILIRTGRPGESALHAGEKIAARFAEQLDRLAETGQGELKAISGSVAETAYCQIMAGIELGRRVAQASDGRRHLARRVQGSDEALLFCREQFARLAADATQEEFHVVCLDAKHQVVGTHRVSVGVLDRSLIHPREVFRPAIKDAAKAILLVHNHPSGDPTPSDDDFALTDRLDEAGRAVGIQILDHIIVARRGATSIREHRK